MITWMCTLTLWLVPSHGYRGYHIPDRAACQYPSYKPLHIQLQPAIERYSRNAPCPSDMSLRLNREPLHAAGSTSVAFSPLPFDQLMGVYGC